MPAEPRSTCFDDNVVAELVDGRLEGTALASAEAHLATCEACRALVALAAGAPLASRLAPGRRSLQNAADDRPDAPLKRGELVSRYEIIDCIGAGAMGTVYAANDPSLDRKVALKLIRAQVVTVDLEARLLREAKAMARLSHPEVIAVYDAGRHGDRLFIAMELVDGGTLREWLRAAPRTWREILAVYTRAGRGLAQAHAAGMVHRDFKPDNVLVGHDGRVRVTDFGLARAARSVDPVPSRSDDAAEIDERSASLDASMTRTGALVGTPVYMAPEQLAGRVADARSDVYSFCVALYEAFYGERPFAGRTLQELSTTKRADDVRPSSPDSPISQRLRRVLLRGLRAKPEERYASMNDVLDALERAARAPRAPFVALAAILAVATAGALIVRPWARPPSRTTPSISASASAAVASPGSCTGNRACVDRNAGAPYLCRASDKSCVPLASEDCVPHFEPGDLLADDTIWIGAMFPTKGPTAAAYGTMNAEGADLARKEIANATRALDGSNASLRVRRVALVTCDDGDDPMRAARHLVDDVGVPAILGFGTGQKLVDVAGSLLISRGVVAVASLTSSPLVTRLPQPPELPHMVWRTTFSVDDVANATARIVHDVLEPRIAAPKSPMRVVLARDEKAATESFAEVLYKQLEFNGKPAVKNGDDYHEVVFHVGASVEAIARVAARIADRAPSLVIVIAEASPALVAAIEARGKPGASRPTFLIANDTLDLFKSFLGKNVDRRRRLFAIQSDSSSTTNARFTLRYNEAHAEKVSVTFNPGPTYDAFYLLAYGAFALKSDAVTGPALARAFERLVPPGKPVEVGPSHVFDALRELAAGRRIDLYGSASPLDFNLANGEAASDFALLCAGIDVDGRATDKDVESGVVFRSVTRRIEGTLRCP